MKYFQDQINNNHCFGCGPHNKDGLAIKSYWNDKNNGDDAICVFKPQAHHCAGPTKFLNGGITATLIDCHCICTAIAYDYKKSGLEIGQGEDKWYATESLEVKYKRPVSMVHEVRLYASVIKEDGKRIVLECSLVSNDKVCAKATVVAVAVPSSWME